MEKETKFAFKVIENKERVSSVVTPVGISKIQYEYQQSVWGYNDAIKAHYLKIGVGYTF